MRLVLALAFAFAAATAACQVLPSEAGIDQAKAVELAQKHAGAVDRLIEVRLTRAVDDPEVALIGLPTGALVWRISFASSEVRPCGPRIGGANCRIDSKVVFIDPTTGEVITSTESGSTFLGDPRP